MPNRFRSWPAAWLGVLGAAVLAGTASSTTPPPVPPSAATAAPAAAPATGRAAWLGDGDLDRVVVIGASVTYGFASFVVDGPPGTAPTWVRFHHALTASLETGTVAANHSSALFFQDPLSVGRQAVASTLREAPSLVVGIDFLFWYGYGPTGRTPGTDDDLERRQARLERGLDELERLGVPVLVGDLPDMRDSNLRMLPARFRPSAEHLALLNQRILDWAEERSSVRIFDLGRMVEGLRGGERYGVPEGIELMQGDGLHPTPDGLLVVARAVAARITASGNSAPAHSDRHRRMVDAASSVPPTRQGPDRDD